MRKQVQFELGDDLGDSLPLPADLASFLGGATDELPNTPHPPAPSTRSSMRPSSSGDNRCCNTPTGEAQPKTGTAASRKSMAASQAATMMPHIIIPNGKPHGICLGLPGKDRRDTKLVAGALVPWSRAIQQGPGVRISLKTDCRF